MGSAMSIVLGRRSKKKSSSPPLPNTNQVRDHRPSITRGPASPDRPSSAEASIDGERAGSFRRPIQVDTKAEATTTPEKQKLCKGVDYSETPIGAEKDTFKFYCPLCMFYYKDMLGTACCKNHVCLTCASEYNKGKGEPTWAVLGGGVANGSNIAGGNSTNEELDYHIPAYMSSMACPHCGTANVQLGKIANDAPLREYHSSPRSPIDLNYAQAHQAQSPLKVGDNFDALRRKMLTFEEESNYNAAASKAAEKITTAATEVDAQSGNSPRDGDGDILTPREEDLPASSSPPPSLMEPSMDVAVAESKESAPEL